MTGVHFTGRECCWCAQGDHSNSRRIFPLSTWASQVRRFSKTRHFD